MSEKAKLKRWERDHSLAPLYKGKFCRECRKFHKTENYCDKWMKKVDPNRYACRYFGIHLRHKKKIVVNWRKNPVRPQVKDSRLYTRKRKKGKNLRESKRTRSQARLRLKR